MLLDLCVLGMHKFRVDLELISGETALLTLVVAVEAAAVVADPFVGDQALKHVGAVSLV